MDDLFVMVSSVAACCIDSDDDEIEIYKNIDDSFDDDYEEVYGTLVEYTKRVMTKLHCWYGCCVSVAYVHFSCDL